MVYRSTISIKWQMFFILQIFNSTFVSNSAHNGGALHISGAESNASVCDSTFQTNKASDEGDDIYVNGTQLLRMPNTSASVYYTGTAVPSFPLMVFITIVVLGISSMFLIVHR